MNPILKNYDLDNIIFKKPEKISDKITIFNIKYNDHDFLIQTPKFFIPDIPTIYCHQNRNFCNLKVIAHNYKFENNTKAFVKKISELDSYIMNKQEYFYQKVKKKKPENIKFINSFFMNKTNTKVNFYFGIQIEKNNPIISIYDWKKVKKNIDYIIPNSYGYSILWLQNVWIKSNKIGINWIIVQMKIYYPILKIDECLIEDEEYFEFNDKNPINKENKIMYKDHEIYSKFFKMKRFKVPIENIKHKLSLENLNPNIIMKNESDYVEEEIVSENLSKSNSIQLKNHSVFSKFFKMKKYQIPIESIQQKMILENLDPNIILKEENEYYQTDISPNKMFLCELQNVKLNSSVNNVKKNLQMNNTNTNNLKKPPSLSDILSSKRSFKKLNLNLW